MTTALPQWCSAYTVVAPETGPHIDITPENLFEHELEGKLLAALVDFGSGQFMVLTDIKYPNASIRLLTDESKTNETDLARGGIPLASSQEKTSTGTWTSTWFFAPSNIVKSASILIGFDPEAPERHATRFDYHSRKKNYRISLSDFVMDFEQYKADYLEVGLNDRPEQKIEDEAVPPEPKGDTPHQPLWLVFIAAFIFLAAAGIGGLLLGKRTSAQK